MTNPLLIEIPTLDIIIPEANIEWAWQQYDNVLLDVLEASLEGVPDELNNIWSVWQSLHERLWSAGFDLVAAMGYVNVLAAEKSKELAYGKSLYNGYRTVFNEALRSKNLRLYLKTRLDIEKQRQSLHLQEQGLRMEFHNGLIEASVKAYNLAVQEYNANITALRLEGERWEAVIAANQVVLKELELQLREAQLLSERERGEIRRQRALLGVQQAEAEVERLGVELLLNAARVLELEMEARRAELQALLVGYQKIEEQAQALSYKADVAIINAQAGEINVLQAELGRISAEVGNILTVNAARDAMYAKANADKAALIAALQAAQTALVAAKEALIMAEVNKNGSEVNLAIEKLDSAERIDDAQFDYEKELENNKAQYDDEKAGADQEQKKLALEERSQEAELIADKKRAQEAAAKLLQDAKIINRFTEYR